MAADREEPGEFTAHERDYSRFTNMTKWGTILVAIIAFAVVLMISN